MNLEKKRNDQKPEELIPGAEELVVRVVSSVDKTLKVKQRFLEVFQKQNYPSQFPYKSKVIKLFQKIEGVDVCILGQFVHEYGSDCPKPNHRRVCLMYLDTIQYFRLDIRTTTGEALRTFVYQEILIGYMEYCKLRGFTSCYLWSCPPCKAEDFIFHCHPEIQQRLSPDKLKEWHLSMLGNASKKGIIVELTNLHDHFFTPIGECKAKVTAARLPYFDRDYWPDVAEEIIDQLQQNEANLSINTSIDVLLMQELGKAISYYKEEFIMVHLQYACKHCCDLMVSGNRWKRNQCANFQLCDKCYEAEQKVEYRAKNPTNKRVKHSFKRVEVNDVKEDTKDTDELLESEFFESNHAFLSFSQKNNYQFDTLRRAKHSAMMVLYHLHNPRAPAFVTTRQK